MNFPTNLKEAEEWFKNRKEMEKYRDDKGKVVQILPAPVGMYANMKILGLANTQHYPIICTTLTDKGYVRLMAVDPNTGTVYPAEVEAYPDDPFSICLGIACGDI